MDEQNDFGLYVNNLFCKNFIRYEINWREMEDTFVSEAITDEEIHKWDEYVERDPRKFDITHSSTHVLISAQTGRGKNHFIINRLIPHAQERKKEILYISNRVALDNQMKRQVVRATHTEHLLNREYNHGDDFEGHFGNVTVLTYNKLISWFATKDDSWFLRYRYVVLDECHFFYSDSLFNAHTWDILKNIVGKFTNSIRIYMTATFDDIIKPIKFFESFTVHEEYNVYGLHTGTTTGFYDNGFAYSFPRDYSNYILKFFSKPDQISNQITIDKSNTAKWLIFVTSKSVGKNMCEKINKSLGDETAIYIDRDSRNSKDVTERVNWEQILAEGKLPCRVLITTSVLDNGFSIRDNAVKNIVIFSDDKTECLQELGRLRISQDKQVNLYLKKTDSDCLERMRKQYNELYDIFYNWYGRLYDGMHDKDETYDPVGVVKRLWNTDGNAYRGLIYLAKSGSNTIKLVINKMARWRTIRLGEQIKEIEQCLADDTIYGSVLYKAKWFDFDKETIVSTLTERDLDIDILEYNFDKLIKYLENNMSKEFSIGSDNFKVFSLGFMDAYSLAFPGKQVNKSRKPWQSDAINNHLADINPKLPADKQYAFKKSDSSDLWSIVHV